MKNQNQTIRKMIALLNNKEADGGFWLPNIQRPFVWDEDQICRLFDSILREYPISTLLVWKTKSQILHRKFIDNWNYELKVSHFNVPNNSDKKTLVLDGQQRLQSLYIGLNGSFNGKQLCFNILSGEVLAPDDIKYHFEFKETSEIKFPFILFKDIINSNLKRREDIEDIKRIASRELTTQESNKIEDHYDLIISTFINDEIITYQELDSIDNPNAYTEDDVVEVFIRANSGGTKLSKSDLLFSLLSASWDEVDKKMENLLEKLNKQGFSFDRDFILKTCLVLLNHGATYSVAKFRKAGVREDIEKKWEDISNSISDITDFLKSKTYIQCDKALPSYLALIPLIYVRYHFKSKWQEAQDVNKYLLRTLLTGAFSGTSDTLVDALVKKFKEINSFDCDEAFSIIQSQGKSLELTENRFWQMGYGSKTIHLLFNLWYPNFTHTPAYDNNLPQIDHIFPRSLLEEVKILNNETNRKTKKYSKQIRNQLANCMLLSREENGAGGKAAIKPEAWFFDKDTDYLNLHLIPHDKSLWAMDRYEDFIQARKILIYKKFSYLISKKTT